MVTGQGWGLGSVYVGGLSSGSVCAWSHGLKLSEPVCSFECPGTRTIGLLENLPEKDTLRQYGSVWPNSTVHCSVVVSQCY